MKNLFIIVFLLSLFTLSAQTAIPLSRNDFLQKVEQENVDLKISSEEVLVAKGDFRQTNAVLLPKISVSYTGISTNNPLMAFGSKLNQRIITESDFNPDLLNNPSQIEDYATRFDIQLPLLNFDGFHERKAARAKLESFEYQNIRSKDYMMFEAEKSYMQLQLAYKTLEVLQNSRGVAQENKRLAENAFNQGIIQKADMLSSEVRLLEIKNQIQYAQSSIQNISNRLSIMMNDSILKVMIPADSLRIFEAHSSLKEVSDQRKDILAMESVNEAYNQQMKADKMSFLPTLNAFGSYQLHNAEIFKSTASGYILGAELKWDILNGTKRFGKSYKSKAEFEKSKLELEQYISESRAEFEEAKRMLGDAANKLQLTSLAMEQSKEAFRVRRNRFSQGLERTTDLLIAEAQYAQKQLEYYATIYEHNAALAYLEFLTKE
ncbi:TolC family protein [Eudoraea sp.]|uniref:TolC family protein n=1 Tax=Eudoraea sp. TaxID=1979955 RepID=UPI003C7747D7